MELQSVKLKILVLYSHNLAVTVFCDYLECVGNRISFRNQRMIPCTLNNLWKSAKNFLVRVNNDIALFAVHKLYCVGDCCTVNLAYCLMTEADTENRKLSCKLLYNRLTYSGIFRIAGTGRKDYVGGSKLFDFVNCYFIVSYNLDIGIYAAAELYKIVGKAVVVINKK